MIVEVFLIGLFLSLVLRNLWNVLKYEYKMLYLFPIPFLLQVLPWERILVPLSFFLLFLICYANRRLPGFNLMAIGAAMNGFAMSVNDGKMPVWQPVLEALRMDLDFKHTVFQEFSWKTLLADYIPVSFPWGRRFIISIGDILIFIGIILFFVLKPRHQSQRFQVRRES